jgi:N-acetylglucosamine-6-phosphate deacetylase
VIAVAGGDVVVADHVVTEATVIVDGDRIAVVERTFSEGPAGATMIDARGCHVVPGFIDVHVHGGQGHDVLDDGAPVAWLASSLPAFGVTAFCPTSVACTPQVLSAFLKQVNRARAGGTAGARVLPAHLESNFVNPDFAGAQPLDCLRLPPSTAPSPEGRPSGPDAAAFSTHDILAVMAAHRDDIAIVTVAPELPGGLELVRALTAAGHCVSLGHSGADYDTALEAVEAGARHATHLFNRMPPVSHRSPGLAGAMLDSPRVAVELIADGVHVHPAVCRMAIAAKGTGRVMAISDGTAAAGLPVGATASLGGRRIHARRHAAELDDGTLAGSVATMDRIFATLVTRCGVTMSDAAAMCALTPARQLGLVGHGVIAEGAVADLVVLGPDFDIRHTIVAGRVVYSRS